MSDSPIGVNYEALETLSKAALTGSQKLLEEVETAKKAVNRTEVTWTGDTHNLFKAKHAELDTAHRQFTEALSGFSQLVAGANTGYQEADRGAASGFGSGS